MQAIRKTLSVLILPAIAALPIACEHSGLPTDPLSAPNGAASSNYGYSSSTVHWVNDDDPNGGLYVPRGTSCNDPGYKTIQSAVNAAVPGDRINVCKGLYQEQVTFISGKDNIRLVSVSNWQAIIKLPPGAIAGSGGIAIVRVTSANGVTILGFTITGPGYLPCNSINYGVRVEGGGSANILGNHIIDIRDNPLGGCQNGVAVGVGRAIEGQTGSAQIIGNVIERYQKNGPTVSNVGSSAAIAFNRVFGIGPTTKIAQNGIQVSGGATATIRHNFVANNIYTPQTVVSTGVLLFTTGQVVTERNTVTSNDVNIYMIDAAGGSRTTDNRVRGGTFDGVAVADASGVRVADNRIEHNGGPGIGIYDATSNRFDDNKIEDNDDSGILLDNGDNNAVGKNWVRGNGTDNFDMTDGIRANANSGGNTISYNRLKNNVTHDCHDATLAGNIWTNNRGQTSSPEGLCSRKDDDDDDEDDEYGRSMQASTAGWDANYAWYTAFGDAADFDWVAAYSAFDTESLLQLLPSIKAGALVPGAPPASPDR
jgi:parallel beta-helix repeat protein